MGAPNSVFGREDLFQVGGRPQGEDTETPRDNTVKPRSACTYGWKVNQAADYVQSTQENSAIREFVADHGQPVDRSDIEHVTIAGRPIAVSEELTEDEREFVADAIRATEPALKACFANALKMWNYDSRFKYAEGFATISEFDAFGFEHAWCMLDGEKLVEVTKEFDHYFGAVLEDDTTLQHHYEVAEECGFYGIISNHHNRFEFLRNRDYIDG